ncbi:MAG: M20 family metallopeptidase [Actinobacteria bacterium]|nr:M20 family metallopeptidase [Actinomycetota bacterium]
MALHVTPDDFSTTDMLADIESLVMCESPSRDLERLGESAEVLSNMMTRLLGSAPRVVSSVAGPHVHWSGGGEPRVLIVGHHDTVHPAGSTNARPFTVSGDVASGPGIFDMKAGIVQALHAVAKLADRSHIEILITADEEIGSHASRDLIIERAREAGSVLVLEPSADGGAAKIARKGTGTFEVVVKGRASHAGLEPEKGVNALMALGAMLPHIAAIADASKGTTVTPTMARAGTADNVVPDEAVCTVDVRVVEPGEKERVESAMSSLSASLSGATVEVRGGMNRPPMHESASRHLFSLLTSVANNLGVHIEGVAVGGGSDGNFTAQAGVHTLDGMGAVGEGAHTTHECISVSTLALRAALLARMCQLLSSMDKMEPLPRVPAAR